MLLPRLRFQPVSFGRNYSDSQNSRGHSVVQSRGTIACVPGSQLSAGFNQCCSGYRLVQNRRRRLLVVALQADRVLVQSRRRQLRQAAILSGGYSPFLSPGSCNRSAFMTIASRRLSPCAPTGGTERSTQWRAHHRNQGCDRENQPERANLSSHHRHIHTRFKVPVPGYKGQ
jgi:hypothetical protein